MKREALLDAAEHVLCEHGTQALTLAAVAESAGVSKGGLLYHFPTKEALIKAMVSRVILDFDDLVGSYVDSYEEGTPSAYSRAYVEATFEILTGESYTRRRWACITAAAADPELIAPLRAAMARWHAPDPAEDPDPVAAMVVRLAAEGLWEVDTHAPGALGAEQHAAVKARLLALLPDR